MDEENKDYEALCGGVQRRDHWSVIAVIFDEAYTCLRIGGNANEIIEHSPSPLSLSLFSFVTLSHSPPLLLPPISITPSLSFSVLLSAASYRLPTADTRNSCVHGIIFGNPGCLYQCNSYLIGRCANSGSAWSLAQSEGGWKSHKYFRHFHPIEFNCFSPLWLEWSAACCIIKWTTLVGYRFPTILIEAKVSAFFNFLIKPLQNDYFS